MNIEDDLPDESDTSDEDYDPGTKEEDVSEVESDGDVEEPLSDGEESNSIIKKRRKGKQKVKKHLKTKQLINAECKENEVQVEVSEDKKKKEDDLWADFMKDTGFVPKNSAKTVAKSSSINTLNSVSNKKDLEASTKQTTQKPAEKVKVKQLFEFAGETVEVEKEVPIHSAEARLLSNSSSNSKVKRSAGLSGIGNVLSQLTKKPKISTLDKTKLDWDRYKKEENLEEELSTHNKGKDGYLERQDFLERADLRRFEIEKELRTVERNKRFNSAL